MNRPKSYARLQKEAEEGNERLPENHGYGGSKVSARPAKRARVQVEEHEDEALRKEEATFSERTWKNFGMVSGRRDLGINVA